MYRNKKRNSALMLYGGNLQKYTKCFKQSGIGDIPKDE